MNTVNNRPLTATENIKFLGMHLDCNLIWKTHVHNLTKNKKTEFDLLYVEKIITHCKCKNVTLVYFNFYSQISMV
jgi:hypothetical protein